MKWVEHNFKNGEAQTHEVMAGKMCIRVTRHIHYEPNQWLLIAEPFFYQRVLKYSDLQEAKGEALCQVHVALAQAVRAVDSLRLGGGQK